MDGAADDDLGASPQPVGAAEIDAILKAERPGCRLEGPARSARQAQQRRLAAARQRDADLGVEMETPRKRAVARICVGALVDLLDRHHGDAERQRNVAYVQATLAKDEAAIGVERTALILRRRLARRQRLRR